MDIEISGLEISARHGVLAEEKKNNQPFIFDVKITTDGVAAHSDDLADTVDYAEVCKLVESVCKNNVFDLIERLAYEAAFSIAERFTNAKSVKVTVHKPKAPICMTFADVWVTEKIERNTVYLSLGSSVGDKEAALNGAIAALGKVRGVEVSEVSDYIQTQPYGGVAKNTFLNCAVRCECILSPRELLNSIHEIEEKFGRERIKRWDDRTLDIDIIFFGNKTVVEDGLFIPHPDYENRAFVLEPLKQIAPSFVCPRLHKRISDII